MAGETVVDLPLQGLVPYIPLQLGTVSVANFGKHAVLQNLVLWGWLHCSNLSASLAWADGSCLPEAIKLRCWQVRDHHYRALLVRLFLLLFAKEVVWPRRKLSFLNEHQEESVLKCKLSSSLSSNNSACITMLDM